MHIPLKSGGHSDTAFRRSYARYVYSEKEAGSHPVTGKDGTLLWRNSTPLFSTSAFEIIRWRNR